MPLYKTKCSSCGVKDEVYRALKDYDDLPECCGTRVERMICPSMVMGDIEPYRSMITGEMIHSRSRHREHLKDHNCNEVGNETKYLQPKPIPIKGLKETLVKVAND